MASKFSRAVLLGSSHPVALISNSPALTRAFHVAPVPLKGTPALETVRGFSYTLDL